MTHRFTGGGLTVAGGEATWKVWQGLVAFAAEAAFRCSRVEADTRLAETVGGTSYVDFRDSTVVVIPVGELGAGVSFQGQHVFMSAGYDLADWFNMVNGVTQPHFNRPGRDHPRSRGDLTFEGLSVKFRVCLLRRNPIHFGTPAARRSAKPSSFEHSPSGRWLGPSRGKAPRHPRRVSRHRPNSGRRRLPAILPTEENLR